MKGQKRRPEVGVCYTVTPLHTFTQRRSRTGTELRAYVNAAVPGRLAFSAHSQEMCPLHGFYVAWPCLTDLFSVL